MAGKRYEKPVMTFALFASMFAGLLATALDPTSILRGSSGYVNVASLPPLNQALLWIGIAMIFAGLIIRMVAIINLRRNFSGRVRIREGHTLVTSGIYHYIRHPAYLGAMILFLGFPVALSSVLGFIVTLSLVAILFYRIRVEEKMLLEHFGAEYAEYMKRSKRLIPFIY
jgi:protein-S-isoprenylcysteine O-methyltransferase Ste14